jgi:signal transduction histidine kinase
VEGAHKATDDPARCVESCRDEILAEFESALLTTGNAVFAASQARRQALLTAQYVLEDVAATLRAGKVQVSNRHKLHAREVGNARAAEGVHPAASLEAGSLFFSTAVHHLARRMAVEFDEPAEVLALAVTGMEESLSRRVRDASESYNGFLLNQVHQAQEDERRRIARELHDRIGHGISVAHQQLALSEVYHATDPARALAKIAVVQQAVQEIMENLRQITSELHPATPAGDLEKSLLSFLETVEDDDVCVGLDVNGDESWADPASIGEAFLIVREAARNALTHAGAASVFIRVDIAPHALIASVQDDGRGFDPATAREQGGVGLASMRERAALLGGRVVISSTPRGGCLVEVFIPLKRQNGGPDGG